MNLPRWVPIVLLTITVIASTNLVVSIISAHFASKQLQFWEQLVERQDSVNAARRHTADSLRILRDTLTRSPR